MRLVLSACFIGTALSLAASPLASAPQEEAASKSALESDPSGWTDLFPLENWKRVPIPPGGKLKDKDPWKMSDDGKTLVCDGVGVHEMLLYDRELGDGVFHVEWKFRPVEGKKGYNSGVYVRNSSDGKIWHQAQVGDRNVGFLFGDTPTGGMLKRFRTGRIGEQRGLPPGEWNTYEITCDGKNVTLRVNGHVTTKWDACPVPKGYVGLESEGWVIEFRNAKWKGKEK